MARNKYEGICYVCDLWVDAETGHFERIKGLAGGWRVKHANVPGNGRVTCEMAKQREEKANDSDPTAN